MVVVIFSRGAFPHDSYVDSSNIHGGGDFLTGGGGIFYATGLKMKFNNVKINDYVIIR